MRVNGKELQQAICKELQAKVQPLRVAFVQFGVDAVSEQFVERKMKIARTLHIEAKHLRFDAKTTTDALEHLETIKKETYDGIVVQLPLPPELDAFSIINAIPVEQDIDMLSEAAKELFISGKTNRLPPVAYAVQKILTTYNVALQDKLVVILGKGKLVGEPIGYLMEKMNVSYVAVDIHTPVADTERFIGMADILISGIGAPHSITSDMIKDGAVLLDAGTSEQGGKVVGDIDPGCEAKALLFTPTPGGIGPLTVIGLFNNLFEK